ncbi:branched-chain amino acid ABC transporter permease [Haloferacaceae archaeon DSL9]
MSTDLRDRAARVGGTVSERLEPIGETIAARDWLIILSTLFAIYALFAVFVLNQGLNSVVGTLRILTFFIAVYAMLALALNLHWGYTGLFNIGVAGFMAVGVYTMGMLAGDPGGSPPGLGLPLPIAVIGGMVASAFVGLIAALPALRLRADYLAIVTLGLSEIIRLTLNSEAFNQWLIGALGVGTGAGSGMQLPQNPVRELFYVGGRAGTPTAFGETVFGLVESVTSFLSFLLWFSVGPISNAIIVDWGYVVVLLLFVGAFYWLLLRVGFSPFGRVLKSIREDELVASSLGKHTQLFKIKVFMLGCALMGLAGILWQGSFGYVNPNSFMPIVTFYVFIAVIVGGSGSNTGSVVGAILFVGLLFEGPRRAGTALGNRLDLGPAPNTFTDAVAPLASLDVEPLLGYAVDNIAALQFVLLGVVLIVLMQRRPEGVLGYRSEPAAAVDLSRRPQQRAVAADGGEDE